MCGRFVVAGERRDLLGLFEVEVEGDDLPGPSWDIRPTEQINVVLESDKDGDVPVRRLESARWSLVPGFSDSLKTKVPTFNARSESVGEKTFFKKAVLSKRALIPASGYYEWKTIGKTKTPYFIHSDDHFLAFAGLYSWWRDKALAEDDPARWVLTATILTRDAVGHLRDIHARTPVVLPSHWWGDWLDPRIAGDQSFVDAAVDASTPVVEALDLYEVAPIRGENRAELINPL